MDASCFIQDSTHFVLECFNFIVFPCTHYHITQKYPPYWLSSKEGIYQWNDVLLIVWNYRFDFLCQKAFSLS